MRRSNATSPADAPSRRENWSFNVALLIYVATTEIALLFDRPATANQQTAGRAAALALATGVALWVFAQRGHRWPRWFLLALLVAGTTFQILAPEGRVWMAAIDAIAVALLARGWRGGSVKTPT